MDGKTLLKCEEFHIIENLDVKSLSPHKNVQSWDIVGFRQGKQIVLGKYNTFEQCKSIMKHLEYALMDHLKERKYIFKMPKGGH